jgi:hypothetical protein
MILDHEVCEPGTTSSPPSRCSAKRSSGRGRTTTRLSLLGYGTSKESPRPLGCHLAVKELVSFRSVSFVAELKGPFLGA